MEIPRLGSEPWIHITVQRLAVVDGEITDVVDRWGSVHKKLSDVALEHHEFSDPVPRPDNTISVAGMAIAIEHVAKDWIADKYSATVVDGEVILE